MSTGQDALPGLALPAGPMAHIVDDVEATIAALTDAGHIKDEHRAMVGMVRLTATKLAAVGPYGQAYGVAQLLRELRECLASLPGPTDDGNEGERREFAKLVAAVHEAEAAEASAGP